MGLDSNISLYFVNYLVYSGILVMAIALLIFSLSYFLMTQSFEEESLEKLSAYECGFTPFQDTRSYFDIRFYIVCILFIIFDIELALLFVWCVIAEQIGFRGFIVVFVFMMLILIGYIYEMMVGALDFE